MGTHHPGLPGTISHFSFECASTPESFHPVLTGTVGHLPPPSSFLLSPGVQVERFPRQWLHQETCTRGCLPLSPQRALYLLAAKEKLGVGLYPVASAAGPGVGAGQEMQTLGGESNICPTAQRCLKPRRALGTLTCWQLQSISAPLAGLWVR